jgi:steroid delta-isomerase-like uncharacterized protein
MRRTIILSLAFLLSFASLFTGLASAQDATPSDDTAANENLVRDFYAAINAGDLDAFDQILAPDVIDHNPSTADQPPGREGVKAAITELRTGFPDFSVTNEEVIASGDKVIVRSTARGTHTGTFVGIPPTGKQVEFAAIDIHRVAEGQIVEIGHVEQLLTLLIQIGVVTPPSAPASPAAAMPTSHPVVGSWELDQDADDPASPPGLVIFGADGTFIELHERDSDGAGTWAAIDEETVSLTVVFHQIDADLVLEGTATVQATIQVSGDTFTAQYTVAFTAPDGTVVGSDEGTATATRIGAASMVPIGTPAATPGG